MDPLIEAFHRINPTDHSVDGLPVTFTIVAFVLLLVTSLVLRLMGRSWLAWHLPAVCVLFAWWAGVNVGRTGFGSGASMPSTVLLLVLLVASVPTAMRAALVPAKRDGRR